MTAYYNEINPAAADGGRGCVALVGLADAKGGGRREECPNDRGQLIGDRAQGFAAGLVDGGGDLRSGPTNGYWSTADWLLCWDGKWRPVEPGTFALAHGLPRGMGSMPDGLRRLAEMAGLEQSLSPEQRATVSRVSGDTETPSTAAQLSNGSKR